MLKISVDEMVKKIKAGETFSAICNDFSFTLSIETYVPYICTAIHNGGNLRRELREKINLNKLERLYEEDPLTGSFINSLPIKLIANDSRYEYDLNRSEEECVYEEAWGKQVWKEPLTVDQKELSLKKHSNFYKVLHALTEYLESSFGACIIYDIHSYNYKRREDALDTPVFNVGTERIKQVKFRKYINHWLKELGNIHIDSIPVNVAENKVFYGRGNLLAYVQKNFKNVLVLATEVKKIYMDEINGDEYPEVIESIQKGLKTAILNHISYFAQKMTSVQFSKKYHFLAPSYSDALEIVDSELYKMLINIEILHYVNPLNIESEKKKFFASKFKKEPIFRYKPLPYNVNEIKRDIYLLPTEKIKDIHFKELYELIIEAYVNKLEMLSLRGQKNFLYSSLKYFGKPEETDILNAHYILHCSNMLNEDEQIQEEIAVDYIKNAISTFGFKCNLELVKNLAAKAMVVNSTKTLKLRKNSNFGKNSLRALVEHEIGVHMLTTMNATKQKLKFLRLGLPVNTQTQEGLAILSEYLSNTMTLDRLKELALRVLAVDYMVKEHTFCETFEMLTNRYNVSQENAFYLTTRVFRGGGFTKDYLYLKGFKEVLDLYNNGKDLTPLFLGKCSINHKAYIDEFLARKILTPPKYISPIFSNPETPSEIIEYIVRGIR